VETAGMREMEQARAREPRHVDATASRQKSVGGRRFGAMGGLNTVNPRILAPFTERKRPPTQRLPRAFVTRLPWLLRASFCLFSCSPARLPCSCSRWRGSPLSAHRRCGSRRLPGASSARSRTRSRRVSRGTASLRSFSQATGVRAAPPPPPHDSSAPRQLTTRVPPAQRT
jgi:hypothetical protein